MLSEDSADDWLLDLPVSNAESLSNCLAGELSSSADETNNQEDGVTEVNNKSEVKNNKDSLPLGVIVKKWNKIFEVKDVEPFTESTGSIWIEALHNPVNFFLELFDLNLIDNIVF
ncbi:hypothetical protein QYM36_010133 [Artemia franciscana]|uniref:Uncharacterized protein n=1 Tax=Artemia franciscana TaxID=6661 RepID=A0AA88LBL2_ARTSF|nr:hypothetical protein QYM36_010133 [Artemia franciscana]